MLNKKPIYAIFIISIFLLSIQLAEPTSATKTIEKGSKTIYESQYWRHIFTWGYKYYSSKVGRFYINCYTQFNEGYSNTDDYSQSYWITDTKQTRTITFKKVRYNRLKITRSEYYNYAYSYSLSRYVKTTATPYRYFKARKYTLIRGAKLDFT